MFNQFITIIALIRFPFRSTCLCGDYNPLVSLPKYSLFSMKGKEDLHSIKLITLNAHVPRAQMLHPSPPHFRPNGLFKNHERFVPLTYNPLVGFLLAGSVGGQEEARPETQVVFAFTFCCGSGGGNGSSPIFRSDR